LPPTVLFDLDGTLTDPREGIVASLRSAFTGLGAPVPSDAALAAAIGPPLRGTFARLLPDPSPARVERAVVLYREHFDARGWRENALLPQVPELLEAVRGRGWRAVIATSKATVFARRIARHFGLDTYGLAAVYGSELDGLRAGKPELLAHVLDREGIAPAQAAMVGDRRHDVEGAAAVGIASVAVTWGYGTREELATAGADWICATVEEVIAALDAALAPAAFARRDFDA